MKKFKKPLLSLCIPTFNRSNYLKICLDSIISDEIFDTGDIEIIVSDNASTDNTPKLLNEYTKKYEQIIYHRNDKNIEDRNFPTVISIANGTYRKLLNDTSQLHSGSLQYMLNAIKSNIYSKPVLFFSNKESISRDFEPTKYSTLEEFTRKTSYFMTWIGSFGIWEEDFEKIKDKFEGCDTRFWHTQKLLSIITEKQSVLIYQKKIITIQNVIGKNLGYGIYHVFINNYLNLLAFYVVNNKLSKKDYVQEEKNLLFGYFTDHFINMIFNPKRYNRNGWDGIDIFLKYYVKKSYFSIFFLNIIFKTFQRVLNKLLLNFRKVESLS